MPIVVLSNIYTHISFVNRARYISINIVPNNNDIFNFQLVNNKANNCSILFLTKYKYNFM